MSSETSSEPDRSRLTIYVGQDRAGHWLVQDSVKRLEGRFVTRAAALSFAEAERQIYHARLELASDPMVPLVPFMPASSDERVPADAA